MALNIPSVRLGDGDIADAYAIGKNNETFPLQASTILGISFTPAMVNVAHYAPFGDSQDGTSVSVYVDDAEAIPNFKFGTIVNNVELAAGEHLIEIKPTGTDTVAISATVTLDPAGMYSVIATGDGANQPLALKVLDDSTAAPADGSGKLRVGHLAPFAADLAATQVDICLADGTPIAPLQGVAFDVVSDFLELPAGDYDFIVTIAGSNCETVALDIPSVRLGDGDIADAYAIGKNNETFPLQVSTILGISFTPELMSKAFFPHMAK